MTKNIIVHTSDINADGIGDLIYFLNWLKVFHKFYKGSHQQLVIIFADDKTQVEKFLLSFSKTEPEHPLFNFLLADVSIKPAVVNNQKIGALIKTHSPMAMVDIRNVFPYITDNDVINLFRISVSGNMIFKNQTRSLQVDKVFGIFEFDALPPQVRSATYSTLGLEVSDFGLLHDIGITGSEDIEPYLEKLSPATKKLIFQNESIPTAEAKTYLSEIPSVFAYLFPLYDAHVLESVLQSPIIQKAIEQDKAPLFFTTNLHEGVTLPSSIQEAAKKGKIRIVASWLPPDEFNSINAIFMNRDTNSIVIPSGDNTLTACIKAGKFPLYAHKKVPEFMKLLMPKDFKLGIFRSMLKILNENAKLLGWDKDPGFNDCNRVLVYLSQANHDTIQMSITKEMQFFFATKFAPYLMEKFAFEKRSLPAILGMIKSSTVKAKPEITTSSTVQFDASKAVPAKKPVASTTTVAKETIATQKDSKIGFKAGFLL